MESRRRMVSYLRGLLSETERKNGWTLAESAGDAGPEGMQRLQNFYAWDTEGLRDDVREVVAEAIGDAERGVLIVDETGFLKKGTQSAGVARQYSGTAGRIENSQIGVFLAYAADRGRALIDRELYLPKEWTADRDRCRAAGIDDDIEFATKPVLARRMIERALDAGVPFGWVTGDEAYGQDTKFRLWLESREIAHVVAVPKNAMVVSMELAKVRASTVIDGLDESAWHRVSCGVGAHGERIYDWAAVDIRPLSDARCGHWLAGPPLGQRPCRHRLLRVFRLGRHQAIRTRACRRKPLGHRRILPNSQERNRTRSIPGPRLYRLVSTHHPVHGRRRVPAHPPAGRGKGDHLPAIST